jgi:hypothetical protein
MRLGYHAPIFPNPGIRRIPTEKHYDIFFTICGYPQDLIMFNALGDVKEICTTSVCLLDELWIKEIVKNRYFLRILAKFDVVMLYYSETVKPLSELLGPKCFFLPPGVDSILFCPDPDPPERVVDVYSIGRRSEVTHQKLLDMARESGLFYLHDSIGGSQAINSREHRTLFANVAKRSRYFIVNPGKIDEPEKRGSQLETSNRYFEGAASGAIMIGECPDNDAFGSLFDWPDAVVRLAYDSPEIDVIINELDRDPDRQERIRRTGVIQALTRHDWVYRWEAILQAAGREPMRRMLERKNRLRELAERLSANTHEPSLSREDLHP